MFSIGLVAIATVTALPIGGGATTYISMNEQIAAYGMEPTMGMFDMCIARIPVLIIALVCAIWICPKLAPDRDVENDELKLRAIKETEPLSPFSALKPVVFMLCVTYGWNPVGLLALTWVGCFMSYLSPLSTISIPFLMDAGGYNQRDLLKMGWIPALLIIVTVVPWTLFMFPPV